jgi:acyl-CoA reductase-like NAD-dependent aldehyde dehydrogenase
VKNTRRITAELGNVSAMIVVPGPWSRGDIAYQAENIVSSLANNAGFNCNATRVVVTHAEWDQRRRLLAEVRQWLGKLPERLAYYPGAADRHGRFLAAHPEAERFGGDAEGALPWAFIPDLDPQAQDDICYNTEAFCGVFGETALPASHPAEFLDRAVEFANDTLWGSLNITLIVHPTSLRDPATAAALERAVETLRFGTVSINHWAAVGFGLMTTTWGAHPGHDLFDIQSGFGVVHNTLMFDRVQKSVIRAPFKAFPKPPWFVSHGTALGLARALTSFEANPGIGKLPGVFWHGLRG